MSIDISLIPQERIKDLVSTLDTIQNNISTIDENLTTTTNNLSTLQTNVTNNYTTLDNKIDSESSRIINIMDSSCVHKTGDETISGNKTFIGSNPIVLQNNSGKNTTLTLKDSTTAYGTSAVDFVQATSNNFNQLLIHFKEGNKWCTNWEQDPTSKNIKIYFTGSEAVFAPTPATSDNNTKIATTNWSRMVHPIYPNITTSTRLSVPAGTDYSIPYDCWVWWGNTSYVGVRYLYVNGIEFGHSYGNSGHWEEFNTLFFPIKAGNVIRHTGENSTCFLYQNVY